ncbi:MAG: ATP-binding cassette domain-containing protein [Gammaproteobacteria bacterium]|nr:ATP-binding cassette domain-containing protein [Gammaproteobacteria bacterium]
MIRFPLNLLARARRKNKRKRKQRVVTPLVMQMHMTECGAACLSSILAYFGCWVPLSELRNLCGVNRDGSTAAGLVRAARLYGLDCSGRSVNARHLLDMPLPQILFWEWKHFLVLEGFDGKRVFLNDPAMGRRVLSLEEFEAGFSGITLVFKLTPDFQPGGKPPGLFQRLPVWFQGSGSSIAYLLLSALMMAVLVLLAPITVGLFVDHILIGTGQWGLLAAGILVVVAILVYFLSWIKQQCIKRLTVRMSILIGNRILTKLFRLPVEYFQHRLTGDLTNRIMSIDKISRGLYSDFIGLLIEATMSTVFLIALFYFDTTLASIILGLVILYGISTSIVERMRHDANVVLRREQNVLTSEGMLMLQQADNLRMTATDDNFFSRWSGHQARELRARQHFAEFGYINSATPGLFMILAHAAVLAVGANQVIAGQMTLGSMTTVYILAGMLFISIGRFPELTDGWQTISLGLQRLEDIMESEEDPRFRNHDTRDNTTATLNGRLKLSGYLELRGITFGYDRGRPPLIKDFNLVIKPGQRTAIVGKSGSGKSTLTSLVSGSHEPWSGEILFDGLPRENIPLQVMIRSLSMVSQEPFLFSATIRENITLWNYAVPDNILVQAARDACIHDRILSCADGYATQVDEGGGNFSGGECQRLEIARALASNPTILILDEATSALDSSTEKSIDDAIRRRGMSCLIVAHRLSTIRDCDEIVVLDEGVAIQRGTHEQLMAEVDGLYLELVQSG